jgi:hypothetical protein
VILALTGPISVATYELPPDYISGENQTVQTVHPKASGLAGRPTGQVIIIVAGVPVHECWRVVPPVAQDRVP